MDCHSKAPYVGGTMQELDDRKERERRAALGTLDRLRDGGETFLGSTTGAARRAGAHFAGKDAEPDDWIEVWGRRIGRGLGAAAVIALAIRLYVTSLR